MGRRKLTTEEFIEKAREVHGDKYGYGKVVYQGRQNSVIITCFSCGDFSQRPADHCKGSGCPSCKGTKLTTSEILRRCTVVHNGGYLYPKHQSISGVMDNVVIYCKTHGYFNQRVRVHLAGSGCPKCGRPRTSLTTEEFITRARTVHGERYDYRGALYVNTESKVTVTCIDHGDFNIAPRHHLSGQGCPSCADSGYNKSKQGYVYFLLDMDTHSRIKIGISNKPEQRIKKLKRDTPFDIAVMRIVPVNGEYAPLIEKMFHASLVSANLTGFDGATEWFEYNGELVDQLIEFCESKKSLQT